MHSTLSFEALVGESSRRPKPRIKQQTKQNKRFRLGPIIMVHRSQVLTSSSPSSDSARMSSNFSSRSIGLEPKEQGCEPNTHLSQPSSSVTLLASSLGFAHVIVRTRFCWRKAERVSQKTHTKKTVTDNDKTFTHNLQKLQPPLPRLHHCEKQKAKA